ncbi:fimbrial protein [Stenotrophomonas sp. BIGb0135]|uniref:fimbrial protein n=1 Tax=Stenotrophomonas sp. BIGb0135 TaxID=2940620 RepID=UPI0021683C5E|nr:fimbrial protein [Stenotrophomonas sp. BIGb0135]MCS4233081.1 type 1 fimbria pilin [Stenotrophomonas sp. BIGb0135]
MSPHFRSLLVSAAALALLGLLWASPAQAGRCSYLPEFPTALRFSVPITGTITVGRDLPIGAEIYRRSFSTTRDFTVACDRAAYTYHRAYSATPYPLSSYTHPTYGARIYTTAVPGIGAAVLIGPGTTALPVQNALDYSAAPGNPRISLFADTQYILVLFKTAATVGAGSIQGSGLPSPWFNVQGDNRLDLLQAQFTGQVNIVSRTCSTPDVLVNLGTHPMTALAGVGTGTAWVDVPVRLNNCPAFHARSLSGTYNDRGQATQGGMANTLQYRVDPVTAIVNTAQSVMALQPDGVNQTATGIGIQVGTSTLVPVGFGTPRNAGLPLNQVDGSSYTLLLKARYYQTGATPTSGQANGAATITLVYQ